MIFCLVLTIPTPSTSNTMNTLAPLILQVMLNSTRPHIPLPSTAHSPSSTLNHFKSQVRYLFWFHKQVKPSAGTNFINKDSKPYPLSPLLSANNTSKSKYFALPSSITRSKSIDHQSALQRENNPHQPNLLLHHHPRHCNFQQTSSASTVMIPPIFNPKSKFQPYFV